MALERHVVSIEAKDQLSAALKRISKEAGLAGDAGEDAGKRGARGMKDWDDRAKDTGRAIGVLTGLAVKLANDAERSQARLEQSVENTGESYEALTPKIEAMNKEALAFAFDDEDASDALASLTDATGDATKAIDDMSLVMDIARARNIDLAAAAKIVAAAEQGRYGSLARLGIQIDDNATREEALGALQAKYAGQAEAYAETNAASWDKMGNRAENALEGIGGKLGDIQGPLIALGVASQLGLGGLATSLFGGSGAVAGVTALGVAAAPLLATMTALAAPIGIATYLILDQDNVMRKSAETTAANNQQLKSYIEYLNEIAGVDAAVDPLDFQGGEADQFLDWLTKTTVGSKEVIDQLSGLPVVVSDIQDELRSLSPAQLDDVLQLTKDLGISFSDPNTWNDDAISALVTVIEEQADAADEAQRATLEYGRAHTDIAMPLTTNVGLIDETTRALERQTNAQKIATDAAIAQGDAAIRSAGANRGGRLDYEGDAAKVEAYYAALETASRTMLGYAQSAASAATSTAVLGSASNVIIGGIDSLGAGIERVRGALEGVGGAGAAYAAVTADAAEAQGYLNSILVNQAPLLADLVDTQTNYLGTLAGLSAEEQLLALAYMDTAKSAQALEMQTLALAAASGELGAGGADFAANIIAGAAQADPVLKAMLVDMQLISVGADGTITVNMAGDARSETAMLTDSINVLITTLGGVPPLVITGDNSGAEAAIATTWGSMAAIGGALSTVTVAGDNSGAEGAIASTWGSMAAIGGALSTVIIGADNSPYYANLPPTGVTLGTNFINVAARRVGIGFTEFAMGGLIDHAWDGGMRHGMTLVGERGPELVSLPGGSLVHNNSASRGIRGSGGGGDTVTINIGTVVANDARQFAESMRRYDRTGRNA